jgi:hypothetical protein
MSENWVGTGSERGITLQQVNAFIAYLVAKRPSTFRHGDCIGADATMHGIVRALTAIPIIKYPADRVRRAWCTGGREMPPMDPVDRDRLMVYEAGADGHKVRVVALPGQDHEVLRDGTWTTAREGIRRGVPVTIIWPDGRIEENWTDSRWAKV